MEITLYNGAREFTAELDVDQDTGEILGTCSLNVLAQRNPIGTAAFILNTLATAEMIDAHIKLMTAKKKALTNNAQRAKDALKTVMQMTGTLSVASLDKTFKAVLSKERDKSVDVFDFDQLPTEYIVEVPATYAADKKRLMADMKDGHEIPGARIIANDRLTIA